MVLVTALDKLQSKLTDLRAISSAFQFPKLQFLVTGKGPLKTHY